MELVEVAKGLGAILGVLVMFRVFMWALDKLN